MTPKQESSRKFSGDKTVRLIIVKPIVCYWQILTDLKFMVIKFKRAINSTSLFNLCLEPPQ